MKKALPFAITLLFVCPILTTTPVRANDGGKGSPSVLHRTNAGQSWLDKAWDDFLDLFRGHHDKGQDKDNGKGPGDKDKGDKDKGPGHREGPGSGNNANDGNGNGNGQGDNNGGGNGGGGNGGSGGGAGDGGSMPLPPTSGGGQGSGSSPSAPIDGGISLLLAAGVGLGVKKFIPKRAPRDPK
jgi:hypothetical protein